jgi:hypothetical protein
MTGISDYVYVNNDFISVLGTSLLDDPVDYTSPVGNDAETYLGLITSWHRGRPLFEQVIDNSTVAERGLQTFLGHLPQDFDLDEAIGAQLDVVGEWVGRSRFISIPIPNIFFAWDDPVRGCDKGIWFGIYDFEWGIERLDDETYRQLLYAKIAANNWDGRVETADDALSSILRDPDTKLFIEDRLDGSMVIGTAQKIPSVLLLMLLLSPNYVPFKPGGVIVYYVVNSVNNTPVFGFDVSNDSIAGFDESSWGVPPDYIAQNPIY